MPTITGVFFDDIPAQFTLPINNGDIIVWNAAKGTFENSSASGASVAVAQLDVGNTGNEGAGVNILGTTYNAIFKTSDIGGTTLVQNQFHRHSTVIEPTVVSTRSNTDTAAHAPVTNGMPLFSWYAGGRLSSFYGIFGRWRFEAAPAPATISDTSSPGRFVLSITPDGSIAPADIFFVDQTIGAGGAPISNFTVVSKGTVTGNSLQGGFLATTTVDATAATAEGFHSLINSQAAIFTIVNAIGFRAGNITKGAGSVVTNQHGFFTDDLTQGTNNFGITLQLSAGANKSNINCTGTAKSTFAGPIQPSAAGSTSLGAASTGWGNLYMDFTNTGTVGAVTINKPAGRVNVAAAATSIVVTNNKVTAASKVFCSIATNDATAQIKNVVPALGSFTINIVAATAQTAIDFFVVNAD